MTSLELAQDGALFLPKALNESAIEEIERALMQLPQGEPGLRLAQLAELHSMLGPVGAVGSNAVTYLGPKARPVRVILFDKTADQNWSLTWHQDRTVAVRTRIETEGFGPWTVKSGIQHVAPPQSLLDRMLTMRVHLDPVDEDNAPLLVAKGSHRLGRIAEKDVPTVVANSAIHICTAMRGDIWLYSTPILHASAAAKKPSRRRVLQLDYSADSLPNGLEWAGI